MSMKDYGKQAVAGFAIWAILMSGIALFCETAKAGPLDGDWYAEIGVGYNTSLFNKSVYQWENAGSPGFMGTLSYEFELTDGLAVGAYYSHYSQWFAGPPFNDDAESSLDSIGFKVRWRLNR
jgi:hypothetical protein